MEGLVAASKNGNLQLIRSILQLETSPHRQQQSLTVMTGTVMEENNENDDDDNNNSNTDNKLNKRNPKMMYEALVVASQYGNLNIVKCLVEQGQAPVFYNHGSSSALHVACSMGRIEVVKYLASTAVAQQQRRRQEQQQERNHDQGGDGIDDDKKDPPSKVLLQHLDHEGNPPHICACCDGNLDIVRHMMETYSILDVNRGYGTDKLTPLHWAARVNHSALASYLLDKHEANVNAPDSNGHTPLHLASRRRLVNWVAPSKNSTPVVDVLWEYGADLYARNKAGNTPLLEALKWDQVDVARRLLEYYDYYYHHHHVQKSQRSSSNPHIHDTNENGDNALSLACSKQNLTMVQFLLAQGASVFNAQGLQALTTACEARHANIIRLLVEAWFGQQQHSPPDSTVGLFMRTTNPFPSGKRKRRPSSSSTDD